MLLCCFMFSTTPGLCFMFNPEFFILLKWRNFIIILNYGFRRSSIVLYPHSYIFFWFVLYVLYEIQETVWPRFTLKPPGSRLKMTMQTPKFASWSGIISPDVSFPDSSRDLFSIITLDYPVVNAAWIIDYKPRWPCCLWQHLLCG